MDPRYETPAAPVDRGPASGGKTVDQTVVAMQMVNCVIGVALYEWLGRSRVAHR